MSNGTPEQASSADDRETRVGLALLLLQATPSAREAEGASDWVKRRVEQLTFLDTRAVRRRVSIDFTVPADAPVVELGEKLLRLVPVTRLPKTDLVAFSLFDEHADALWMPTSRETTRRLGLALVYWASRILGTDPEQLPEQLTEQLTRIVSADPGDLQANQPVLLAAAALIDAERWYYPLADERLRLERALGSAQFSEPSERRDLRRRWITVYRATSHAWDSLCKARDAWAATGASSASIERRLMQDDFLRSQVVELAESFIVHVGVESPRGTRRIVKLEFESQFRFTLAKGLTRRSLQSLGWRCWQVDVLIGGRGGSHHLEVAAPPGVDIVGISAEPHDQQFGQRDGTVMFSADRWRRLIYWAPDTPYSIFGNLPHVHLSIPADGKRYRAAVFMRVSRPGWLTASWLVAMVICGVLIAGVANLSVLFSLTAPAAAEAQAGTAATLLLALLGVFATMLIRPGEHPLASRLLLLARLLILSDALAVLVGVGDLVLHQVKHQPPTTLWASLAGVAAAAFALLTLSWLLPVKASQRRNTSS
jgi:hypothetical protein